MPAHVDCDRVEASGKMRRDVAEGPRHPCDAVRQHQRPVAGRAPFDVVNAQSVDAGVAIGRRRPRGARE